MTTLSYDDGTLLDDCATVLRDLQTTFDTIRNNSSVDTIQTIFDAIRYLAKKQHNHWDNSSHDFLLCISNLSQGGGIQGGGIHMRNIYKQK